MSSVTGFAPAELVGGHLPLMPIESSVTSWRTVAWRDQVSTEELIQRRINLFSQSPEKIQLAVENIKEARMKNKEYFDKTHRVRPKKIEEGDWVLVADNSMDNRHFESE